MKRKVLMMKEGRRVNEEEREEKERDEKEKKEEEKKKPNDREK